MNRHQRRALRAQAGSLAQPIPDSVELIGGPMSGWVVKPDAPALRDDWWTTWPPSVAAAWAPGRYVAVEGPPPRQARWEPREDKV